MKKVYAFDLRLLHPNTLVRNDNFNEVIVRSDATRLHAVEDSSQMGKLCE